jgi:uncharacterized membrane protein
MDPNQTNYVSTQQEIPEPSVSGTFGHSWDVLKKYLPELLLVVFIEILLSLPLGVGSYVFNFPGYNLVTTNIFNLVYTFVVMLPVSYGCSWVYLKAVRGEPFRVTDIFFAYQSFANILIANVLVGLIIGCGILLLIVPGIIFACKLAFVPYLVMDKKMEAIDAIRESWHMTSGHAGTIFLMGVVSCFVALGGLICFIVGIFPATIWISLAFAAMYMAVAGRKAPEEK